MEWNGDGIEIRAQQEANKGLSQEEKQALRKAKKAEKAAQKKGPKPAQPAQPAQLHHRLNAVEENGKPWYEEPNINRLLYRQHQLVSRYVRQSTGCDE